VENIQSNYSEGITGERKSCETILTNPVRNIDRKRNIIKRKISIVIVKSTQSLSSTSATFVP